MKATRQLTVFAVALLFAGQMFCQVPPSTAAILSRTELTMRVLSSPRTAHGCIWKRYNDENLRTGSLWVGYNVAAGKKLALNVTPMIDGVFGRPTGKKCGRLRVYRFLTKRGTE